MVAEIRVIQHAISASFEWLDGFTRSFYTNRKVTYYIVILRCKLGSSLVEVEKTVN